MRSLATHHWTDDNNSRIQWVQKHILNYYFRGGIQSEHIRDRKFVKRLGQIIPEATPEVVEKARVLDVGSCYNPFSVFEELDVTAIDIAPGSSSVKKGDFLSIDVGGVEQINDEEVTGLKKESFHVVIFCLLLEYLPSVRQRLQCIEKAIELLSMDGLLCIITPDSSHMGKNLDQMKAWRKGLALLGLRKMVYEKSKHFHGLIFRKPSRLLQTLTRSSVTEEGANQSQSCLESLFFIPQDNCWKEEKDPDQTTIVITEDDRQHFKVNFEELPDFDL